jgi:diguanylate cyclase (GGDEF)-like protein/PAS domain S-box-containing protein
MKRHPPRHDMPVRSVHVGDHQFQSSLVMAINEASPDGILVVDDKGIIVSHNHKFVEIWRIPSQRLRGVEPDSAIGAEDDQILSTVVERVKDAQPFLARVKELYDNPHLDDHCEIELKDGRTLERHSTVLRGEDDQYLGRVWFFRDVTVQKQSEAALLDLARHDPLTGMANRRFFFERANLEFARSKRYQPPLSIAMMDIDHFKKINDEFGHSAGDEVLKSFCNTSQRLLRETDLFARIGGEEFAVLLPDTGSAGAVRVAERLRREVAEGNLLLGAGEIKFTISIGVATLRSTDTSVEDCLQRADRAMYRAKENGRNCVEIEA